VIRIGAAYIAGLIHSVAGKETPFQSEDGLVRLSFPGGHVVHDPRVSVARDGNASCLICGTPRFAENKRRGASDHEPAADFLEMFARLGADAVLRLKGRFSVVLLRPDEREALIASDRFATWPMCYDAAGAVLAFADRADAVPTGRRALRLQSLFDYFYFHMIPAPATVFDGVERLPAGSILSWSNGSARCERYWTPAFSEADDADLDVLREQFRAIVRRSVEREAANGEALGTFLSGGTDSSTVAGMLRDVLNQPVRTYSIGFDVAGYDEMHFARVAARHFGTEHHEHYLTPDEVSSGMPKVAAHFDQPFGNSSVLPAWVCARDARADGVDKLLAGDGGDELFGGNLRYVKQGMFEWYANVPGMLRDLVIQPFLASRHGRRLPLVRKAASYVEQACVPLPDRAQMHNLLSQLGAENMFTPAFLAGVDKLEPLEAQRRTWCSINAQSTLNRLLGFEWKYTLADNDLPKVVGATQLAGLDVGFPLLDDDLVEFSARLPTRWKVKGLTLRWFFKQSLQGFLPDEIIAKRKHGFGLPFGNWMLQNEGLRKRVADSLDAFASRGVMRPPFLTELSSRLLPAVPGYYGELVWIVVMLEEWLRARAPDWRLGP
jgi:asparagine synthase (glutamine-hydrolysing)